MTSDSLPALLPQGSKTNDSIDQIIAGRNRKFIDPGAFESLSESCLPAPGRLLEPGTEALIVRIDVHLLAGFSVFHDDGPDVRQFDLARIPYAHRHHLMTTVKQTKRAFPTGQRNEIGDDKDQRASLDGAQSIFEQGSQIRGACGGEI